MSWGGGILAYSKSFATFNTHKEFNIIQGKIPNKNNGDVTLAVKLDGEKYKGEGFPSKEGHKFKGYECTNGGVLTWNPETWKATLSEIDKPTVCILEFETSKFDYGDGSLNTIARTCTYQESGSNGKCGFPVTGTGGFIDKLAIYDTESNQDIDINSLHTYLYYTGNYYSLSLQGERLDNEITDDITASNGINEIELIHNAVGDGNSIIKIVYSFGNYGFGAIFSDFSLNLDDNYYTLKQAVDDEKILPIVIMSSVDNREDYPYNFNNPTLIYDGGTIYGQYPRLEIYFMLNINVKFDKFKFSNNGEDIYGYQGSISVYKVNNRVMYLK